VDQLKAGDVVALERDIPASGLRRGQVGTIVDKLDADHFEVEFSDLDGKTYAQEALPSDALLLLHHRRHAA